MAAAKAVIRSRGEHRVALDQLPWVCLQTMPLQALGLEATPKGDWRYASRAYQLLGVTVQPRLHCRVQRQASGITLAIHRITAADWLAIDPWLSATGLIVIQRAGERSAAQLRLEVSLQRRGAVALLPRHRRKAVAARGAAIAAAHGQHAEAEAANGANVSAHTRTRPALRPVRSLVSGWELQRRVVGALVYRELKTRVSEVRFGVVGVFIEPLGVLTVFVVLFTLLHHNPGELDPLLFLLPGAVMFAMFTEIGIRALNAMNANESLFFYKPVKPVDTVIARGLVEGGLFAIVYLTVLLGIFLFRERWLLDDLPLLVVSYLCLALTAFGLGLIFMVAGHRYPSLHQFIPIAIRPLWFISGAFFATAAMPQWLLPWLSWNPVVQATELSRHAFSSDYTIPEAISLPYLMVVAASSCAVGLWLYTKNERFLLTR